VGIELHKKKSPTPSTFSNSNELDFGTLNLYFSSPVSHTRKTGMGKTTSHPLKYSAWMSKVFDPTQAVCSKNI
jgi:hypothetical protein